MILTASGIHARYPGASAPALAGVDCAVGPGELVAVVGPNGSGKTTLLRALLGMMPLAAGRVELMGRPLREWSRQAIARTVGVVTQREDMLFPLRVEETVMLGRYPWMGPMAPPGPEDQKQVEQALARCDLLPFRSRHVDELSGGEWQRVRVARALAQNPRVLLLDEPTAALDIRHEMEVFELVAALVDEGLGALVITHHLNLAARYAGRMLLLNRGELVASGTPAEVFVSRHLESVFQWPLGVVSWLERAPQVVPLRPGEAAQ